MRTWGCNRGWENTLAGTNQLREYNKTTMFFNGCNDISADGIFMLDLHNILLYSYSCNIILAMVIIFLRLLIIVFETT